MEYIILIYIISIVPTFYWAKFMFFAPVDDSVVKRVLSLFVATNPFAQASMWCLCVLDAILWVYCIVVGVVRLIVKQDNGDI